MSLWLKGIKKRWLVYPWNKSRLSMKESIKHMGWFGVTVMISADRNKCLWSGLLSWLWFYKNEMAKEAEGEIRGIVCDHIYLLWGFVICHDRLHFLVEAHRMHLKCKWLYNAVLMISTWGKKGLMNLFFLSLYSPLHALKQNWLQVLQHAML